jgi:hypothetical protein
LRRLNLTLEMTMADARMALLDLIEKSADADLMRAMLAFAAERLNHRKKAVRLTHRLPLPQTGQNFVSSV